MDKIKKIIGSIYTSFLFSVLFVLIILEFFISFVRFNNIEFTTYIDSETIYKYVCDKSCDSFKWFMIDYLNDYKEYIFNKKSYPTVIYSNLNNNQTKTFDKIKNKLDIPYEKVLIIRDINNFFHNNSIYLLLNIIIFINYLLISLRYKSFIKGLYFLALMVVLSSLVILLFTTFIFVYIKNIYIKEMLNKMNIMSNLYKLNVLYLIIGFVSSVISLLFKIKYPLKKIYSFN